MTEDFSARRLDEFYDLPIGCLTLHAKRLRRRFTKDNFRDDAVTEFDWWAEVTDIAMDATERMHNNLRTGLLSSGRVKQASGSIDKAFCNQVAAAHRELGGKACGANLSVETVRSYGADPLPLQDSTDDLFSDGSAACDAHAAFQVVHPPPQSNADRHRPRRCAASVKLRALRLRSFKSLRAPRRPLTTTELEEFESKMRSEWDQISRDPAQRDMYDAWCDAERIKKDIACNSAEHDTGDENTFRGVWGASTDPEVLFPLSLVAAFEDKSDDESDNKKKDRRVRLPVPDRMSRCVRLLL